MLRQIEDLIIAYGAVRKTLGEDRGGDFTVTLTITGRLDVDRPKAILEFNHYSYKAFADSMVRTKGLTWDETRDEFLHNVQRNDRLTLLSGPKD